MSAVLSYKYPAILPNGGGVRANNESWNSVAPLNGAVFRSDQNQSIIFNCSSNSVFLRTTQSFLTGTLTPYASNGTEITSGITNSIQSTTRCFSRMVIRFGGVVVEDLQYNDLLAMYYATASQSKKLLLKKFEGFGDTNFYANGKRKWTHLIMSSLFVTDQCLPLPLLASGAGVQIELFLAPASELFTHAAVSYYTLSGVFFKYMGITPDPAYTMALKSAVQSGNKSAYIHYQRVRAFPSNGNGSKTQMLSLPVGQVSSVASVFTQFYDEVTYSDVTKDKYARFHNAKLIDFRIEAAGQSNPSQLTFRYEGGADPELMMLNLLSESGNAYNMHNDVQIEDNFETSSFRLGMNYQAETELSGTGLSLIGSSSPTITISTTHSEVVPPTTRIVSYVVTDALIEFRGSEISISEVF